MLHVKAAFYACGRGALMFGTLIVLFIPATVAEAATFSAPLVEDTYIVSNEANSTKSGGRFVLMRNFSSVSRAGLAQFQLPSLPPLELVTSAQLTVHSAANGTGQPNLNVVGLTGTQPDLTTTTWNNAITNNIITGRDANFVVQWGSNATIFTGETFDITAGTTTNTLTYTDSTDSSGMLRYILDNIGPVPTTITLGFSFEDNATHDAIWQFRSNNDDNAGGTVAVPPGPVTATLTLFTETLPPPIPEPSTAVLLGLGCLLMIRRKKARIC